MALAHLLPCMVFFFIFLFFGMRAMSVVMAMAPGSRVLFDWAFRYLTYIYGLVVEAELLSIGDFLLLVLVSRLQLYSRPYIRHEDSGFQRPIFQLIYGILGWWPKPFIGQRVGVAYSSLSTFGS
jgi:hypothetical protein